MKINVHVGAHKTATTYLQSILKSNLRSLNANGVGYLPLKECRQLLTGTLMKHEPRTFEIEQLWHSFFPYEHPAGITGLVISDENILGTCGEFADTGTLYPNVTARLRRLRELLAPHEVHLFFSIRRYAAFLAAAYCESLRHRRGYTSFDEYWNRVKIGQFRWPTIFFRMQEALQPASVTLWRYEDFRANAD